MSDTNLPDEIDQRSDRILGGSMALVAVRCTVQYVILPFVLPLFGLGNNVSVVLSTIVEVFSLGMISYNLIRLWHTGWRWRYLAISVVMAGIIGVFLYVDIRHWLGLS